MRKLTIQCLFIMLSLMAGARLNAQQNNNYLYTIGNQPFSTQIPIENGFINVNNGDIHIEIPLAQNTQRGHLQLNERLVYDSRIWKIISNSGYSWSATNVPNSMGGWTFQSGQTTGNVAQNITYGTTFTCGPPPNNGGVTYTESQYTYEWTDPSGTVHPFTGVWTQITASDGSTGSVCGQSTGPEQQTGAALDASGYTVLLSGGQSAPPTSITVYDRVGNEVYPTVADPNGNDYYSDGSGNLVDSRGNTPVLKSTSGNQIFYDVLGVNGVRNRYTVTTETVSFNTSFKQSAVRDVSGNFTAIQSIKLPDGSSYSFSYDSGTAAGNYGEVTSVTLPTGGTIGYGYTNFLDSFQNQNRWINTRVKDGGTTTFTPKTISSCSGSSGCQEQVTVTSPPVNGAAGNDTVYTFNLDQGSYYNASSWNTGIDVWQGSSTGGGSKLKSQATAYVYSVGYYQPNSNFNEAFETPQTITTTTTLSDVNLASKTVTTLDANGVNPVKVQSWDYYSGSAPTSATQTTAYAYNNIVNYAGLLTQTTVTDNANNMLSQSTYAHDAQGNLKSTTQWLNTTGGTLATGTVYDSRGTLSSSTDVAGHTTTYGHDSTDTFLTSVTYPTPSSGVALATSTGYDSSTGVVTSTTDANNQTVTYKNFDSLNRAQEIDAPDGGVTTLSYPDSIDTIQSTKLNGSQTAATKTLNDVYGRASRVAVANGQSSNAWYQQDTCSDASGQVSFQSYRYQGPGYSSPSVCSGSGGDKYSYDALGRLKQIAHGDGTAINYTYKGRATQVKDENGVTRIRQVDGLGRPTSVCEVSSASQQSVAPVACGQDISATGFLTSYSYTTDSSKDQAITIMQGPQTRISVTDSLGRTVSTTEPERGTTTYSYAYNSTGLVVTRKRPKANQTSGSVLTTTMTQYDALGRLSYIGYDDNLTSNKSWVYDQRCCTSNNLLNIKGRLAVVGSSLGANEINAAGAEFSYDAVGNIVNMWNCSPSTCDTVSQNPPTQETRPLSFSYDWAGNLLSETDPVSGLITYGRSPAGEITSITNGTFRLNGSPVSGTPATILVNAANGPNGPLSYALGNGLSMDLAYDTLGRISAKWLCHGNPSANCSQSSTVFATTATWQGQRLLTSGNSIQGANGSYGYDDFNRLTSTNFNNGFMTYSYTYDRYGNRWSQNTTQGWGYNFSAAFDATTNRIMTGGYAYDAAGNMTNDGVHTYTFDADGNILQVDGGSTASYVYSAFNQRVSAQVGSVATEYIYDYSGRRTSAWNPSTNAGIEGRIYADGRQIAFRASDGKTYFNHQNYLGTESARTDSAGALGLVLDYLPFGDGFTADVYETAAYQDPSQFGGLDQDDNSAGASMSDHAEYRNYSFQQGRWLSPDPYAGSYDMSNPQSFNRYAYVGNNPLSFIDPLGLQCTGTSATYDGQSYGGTIACSTGWLNTLFSDIGHLFGFGRPSFKGVVGSPRPPSGKVPCSSVPAAPPGEDYSHNMALQNGMSFDSWLLNELPQGDWDWKDLVDRSWNPSGKSFAAAGNFNYGATCFARGYSLTTCQSGAGVAAYFSAGISFIPNLLHGINPFTMGPGIPFVYGADGNGTPTYGDQTAPTENPTVIAGWNYGASGGCQP